MKKKISEHGGLFVGIAIIISLCIPFVINEMYRKNSGYMTLWEAKDVLSFYGSYLSFVGTVVLGFVAVYQNKQANELSKTVTRLQEATYISFLELKEINIDKQSSQHPQYMNSGFDKPEFIKMTADGVSTQNCFHLNCNFFNSSDYPIVAIEAHCGDKSSRDQIQYGIRDVPEYPLYIPERASLNIRFILPADHFDVAGKYNLALRIRVTNVLDYTSESSLYLELKENKCKYRISKFTDINPNSTNKG